ncbi:hypothetical protein UCMB321_1749 [Pseudomonas batumici]|uniref:Uncharacterized protein n=1 Tax=Pseudomonas batumici TaxID=226910 RepID=A0A0C2F0A6_9PSED|nr:hypothetical protein UCMB321_1749 [Pseudomonas batumici]
MVGHSCVGRGSSRGGEVATHASCSKGDKRHLRKQKLCQEEESTAGVDDMKRLDQA